MKIDPPAPPPDAATEGMARMCGGAASSLTILATLGVSLAMGTAVMLIVTKRRDVARVCAVANLLLAALLLAIAMRRGPACVPIGAMACSLPAIMGIAAFIAAMRGEKRNKGGPEAKSG